MRRLLVLFVIALATILTQSGSGATPRYYYVDSSRGDDSNAGSRSAPWRTIQKAVATMEPGTTVFVREGAYDERVVITRSGRPGFPLTVQAQGTVVMKGFLIAADFIRVIGFQITNSGVTQTDGSGVAIFQGRFNQILNNCIHDLYFEGIWLNGGPNRDSPLTSNNIVSGNRIVRVRVAGIRVEGTNSLIQNNDVSHTIQYPPGAPERPGPDADGIHFFGSGHIIRGNFVHDILLSDSGNIDPHIDCFQSWGPATSILFERNLCDNPNDGMQGWMIGPIDPNAPPPMSDVTIRNNVAHTFRMVNVFNAPSTTIVNNSFKGELFYRIASGYGIELHDSSNSRIQNNLFYDVGQNVFPYPLVVESPGTVIGNNAVFMSNGQPPGGFPMPGDLWQIDPQVFNAGLVDLRPRPTSPLIDAGISLSFVRNDYFGRARPHGVGLDIGAFEFPAPCVETNVKRHFERGSHDKSTHESRESKDLRCGCCVGVNRRGGPRFCFRPADAPF